MAQLGSGSGSQWPETIDTAQTYVNSPFAAPDSATRIDAQFCNDVLSAIVNLQTRLGSNPQGTFGSLAARLQQFTPGGGVSPALFPFSAQQVVTIAGTQHRLGSAALHVRAYDTSNPRQLIRPAVRINKITYDVEATFETTTSGTLLLHYGLPQYEATFTNTANATILGATHQLGNGIHLVSIYDNQDPWNELEPGSVSIDQSTFDVTITFGSPLTFTVLLSASGPRHAATFSNTDTVVIPGASHGLTSSALLPQVYDALDPANIIQPASLTVDPGSFAVTVTFESPTSGTVLLVKASEISGTDFEIRSAGITDQNAVRTYSQGGALNLQTGTSGHVYFRNATGSPVATLIADGRLGINVDPTFQLQLAADSAAKPVSSAWTIFSDERLKKDIRPFTDGLAVLVQLVSVLYRYNGKGGMPQDRQDHIGFLAQAVQAVAPYMVKSHRGRLSPDEDETDILTLDTDPLLHLLLNAVKELASQNDALTERVAALESHVAHLQGQHT